MRADPMGSMTVVWWVACWAEMWDRQKVDAMVVKWVGMLVAG